MTFAANQEQLQFLILEYLYGDLNDQEMRKFEQRLHTDPALQEMLDREQRLNSALPIGSQPFIDDERIQGNRWLLRQNLQREARPRFSLTQWLRNLAQRPVAVAFQGAAMAMTFGLGIMLATPSQDQPAVTAAARQLATSMSPLDLVNDEDYEIYQLKVNNYDANSGAIDLSFSLVSETRVRGNVADQNVSQLMAVALQDDISSAARLDTIQVLQSVASGNAVYEALINVLMHDQNPGVRYQAVQALVRLSDEERVRDALRYALREDVNQGVRVEAFNALVNYRDEQTLAVFREQMDKDSNEYIRAQARFIVEGGGDSAIVL
jgi:anti-sigma-K factor RskA